MSDNAELIISVYFRNEESEKPQLLKRYTIDEYCDKIQGDIDRYKDKLPRINKKSKTYRKVQGKILLLKAYSRNIRQSSDKDEISQVFATSGIGRYRIENDSGTLLSSVYESDGRTIYRFQYRSEIEDAKERIERAKNESSDDNRANKAWERLKGMLDT